MKRTLLHACCAPCAAFPVNQLKGQSFSVFFYNPNIDDPQEYQKRLAEIKNFLKDENVNLIEGAYDPRRWMLRVEPLKHLGEGSARCGECFRFRLHETFLKAREYGFDAVSTVLSVSPHKNASLINEIGRELSKSFGIDFIENDFKKNGGFAESSKISREKGFYRQNYCGCGYSREESNKRRTGKNGKQNS